MGGELNNTTFSKSGTTLYQYIKKGKYEMNTYKFQHNIGGTAACKEIIIKDTKVRGKIYPNETLFYDSWLNGVKKRRNKIQRYYIITVL